MKTTASGSSRSLVAKVAIVACPDWSTTQPAGVPGTSVIWPGSGRPAFRRDSIAPQTLVAATGSSSPRSRRISSTSGS